MSSRAIEVAIQKLAGVHKTDDLVCMVCTVQSVNEDAATCDCMGENDMIIPNVKLQAGVCDGLLILPVAGSTVIIAMSKYNEPFVFMVSDVDKFYLQVGNNSSITVTNDGKIQLNDGSFDGLVKVKDITTQLNNIEDLLNGFIDIYNAHTHTVPSFGTSGVPGALETSKITSRTNASNIQNDKITHGK